MARKKIFSEHWEQLNLMIGELDRANGKRLTNGCMVSMIWP
jgi:hypothetical protein